MTVFAKETLNEMRKLEINQHFKQEEMATNQTQVSDDLCHAYLSLYLVTGSDKISLFANSNLEGWSEHSSTCLYLLSCTSSSMKTH